jgi:hypothetical protein
MYRICVQPYQYILLEHGGSCGVSSELCHLVPFITVRLRSFNCFENAVRAARHSGAAITLHAGGEQSTVLLESLQNTSADVVLHLTT